MITRDEYYTLANRYFSFLEKEYNYKLLPLKTNNSILYDTEYGRQDSRISISYEIGGEGVNVILFWLINGNLPDYDDKTHTVHLNALMKQFAKGIDKSQIDENNHYFKNCEVAKHIMDKELFKNAKQLRLALKQYLP